MNDSPPVEFQPRALGVAASVLVGVAALALLALLAHFYLKVFEPPPYVSKREAPAVYDRQAMWQAVEPARVQARQADLLRCGSRFLGQPGTRQAGESIAAAFRQAGLEVIEHQVTTASPLTEYREIYRQTPGSPSYRQDEKLDDVEVYPFLPNHLAPVTTGDEGITGRLVLATPELLHTGQRFDDQIALIDAKPGAFDPDYGFDWTRYARAGFRAVIVSDSAGMEDAPWSRVAGRAAGQTSMVSSVPVNFVRLAATPAIFGHVGENVRLRVQVRFAAAPNTTYYGVFHAAHPVRQAICLLMPYDVPSVLPDLGVGAEATVAPAFALQFLAALPSYRETMQRDVIFVAYGSSVMGEDGINHLARILQANTHTEQDNPLLKALGIQAKPGENKRVEHLEELARGNQALLEPVQQAAALLDDAAFLADPAATAAAVDRLPEPARLVSAEQFSYVMDALALELAEPALQRKLAFLRSPGQNARGPEFQAYLAAKQEADQVSGYTGYAPASLLRDKPEWFARYGLRERFRARLGELLTHHRQAARQLEQEKAVAGLFNRYADVAFFGNRLVPAADGADPKESVVLSVGQGRATTPVATAVFNVLVNASHHLPAGTAGAEVILPGQATYGPPPATTVSESFTDILDRWGYATYTLYNRDRDPSYDEFPSPLLKPYMQRLDSLRGSFAVYAGALLAFAHGVGPVAPSLNQEWIYFSFGGQVLVSGVGQSAVPHHPLDGAAVANRSLEGEELYSQAGRYENPILLTDPYGKFLREFNSNDFPVWWRVYSHAGGYSPVAAGYDREGAIQYIKDEGEEGQRLFKSLNVNIRSAARENTTIVAFRAAPLSLLDLTNPQTMKDYTSFDFLSKEGFTQFGHQFFITGPGLDTVYLEPDRLAYVLLQSGAPGNDLVQQTRAFLLGIDDPQRFELTRDIDGPGYLVADHPFLRDVSLQAARSMAAVNGHRLSLQEHYHMADPQTEVYQQKTLDRLADAGGAGHSLYDDTRAAREAVTYATLNHPVIRQKIVEAVISIIWYLALLVPFAFFFEKLVFAFADVRRQIAAQAAIFLTVFVLLWILHPAFSMVRSSLMILLGFIIVLISGGITMLFSSKFKENLEDFRKRRGQVAGASANTLGVVGSAFLLGLNNMNRRKVRTGLTCATLTLLTFVMISFTSVQNGVVEEDIAIGKAPYQGMLVKKEHFEPISDAEVSAFNARYGDRYDVCRRRFIHGVHDPGSNKNLNPTFTLTYQDATGANRTYDFRSVLQMTPQEPLRNSLGFVGQPTWFTPEQAEESREAVPILIPDKAASALGINPALIESSGGVRVSMVGREYLVIGIFAAESLDGLRDLDGLDLRPFNIEAVPDAVQGAKAHGLSVADDATRIPAEQMFLSPVRDVGLPGAAALVNSSLAVSMPQAGYKEASGQIVAFMEQIARPVFYGLDGVAFKGKRTREVTLAGLVDLIVPLIIAGLTVLNTMRGSVYERSGEIFVYNAVGIAPRYVFFMFMAEAMVYAVVGSVLGFLLSQGVGRILTELGWTGGLNMTYASLPTIYASLTIVAAVFVSTYFPARSAMNIAKPADEAGWKLPAPQGDVLAFDLPFNFLLRGRMAVLVFFDRYLLDHAEGGMGTFSAAVPTLGAEEPAGGDGPVPCLRATVWLKPFDLAVSQQVVISLPRDEETGQYKARVTITRISGTRESWLRLNQSFVQLVRRHFLYWRAVGPAEQEEMFLEARAKFEREVLSPAPALVPA